MDIFLMHLCDKLTPGLDLIFQKLKVDRISTLARPLSNQNCNFRTSKLRLRQLLPFPMWLSAALIRQPVLSFTDPPA